MAGINLALGAATGVYLPDFGSSRGGGWSPESRRDAGLFSRVVDRVMDSPVGSAIAITGVVGGSIVGLAAVGATLESNYKDHAAAALPPMHVAVMDQGVVRSDYGYANVTLEAMHGSKGGAKNVHAPEASAPGRGAQATDAMLGEMRRFTRNPIIVHAYDPFVKAPDGSVKLDLDGIREIAPRMAKDGVKVAVTPFAVPGTAEGRELSRIMAKNGIAVFSATADRGVQLAPGMITVRSSTDVSSSKAHFSFDGNAVDGIGSLAGTGAIKEATSLGLLNGSRAIAHAMQSDMKEGVVLVDRSHRRPRSITPVAARPEIPVAESSGPVPLATRAVRTETASKAPASISKGIGDGATAVAAHAAVRSGGASR